MRVIAVEASTSTIRGGMTTIVGSSPKPAASLQSSAAGRSCWAASGPAGGAGDERSPLGAATARAAHRSAEGTANPIALSAKGLPEKLSILGGRAWCSPVPRRAAQRRKEQDDAKV
jgi:hypothetical protein